MKKISVYAKNGRYTPSAYYTVTQYMHSIENINYHINSLYSDPVYQLSLKGFFRKGIGNHVRKCFLLIVLYFNVTKYFNLDMICFKPDTVIVCKSIFPRYLPSIFKATYLRLLKGRKIIWVFDDDILLNKEISRSEWDILCSNSTMIMVTHDSLKKLLPLHCQGKVSYIPQSDGDISREIVEKYKTDTKKNYEKTIHLVWVASDSSMPNLSNVIKSLDQAASELQRISNKQLVLNVVCNISTNFKVKNIKVNNIAWTRQAAIAQMAQSHIGIMPLIDNAFNRGKGGFKLIQCMTADLPVIASNVGWNPVVVGEKAGILVDDFANTDVWIAAIIRLSTDYDLWTLTSMAAKVQVERYFSFEKNKKIWQTILEESDE